MPGTATDQAPSLSEVAVNVPLPTRTVTAAPASVPVAPVISKPAVLSAMLMVSSPAMVATVSGKVAGSVMEKGVRLSVPEAPPPRFVPELALSVPKPMSTVSLPVSAVLSAVALRVSVTLVAVVFVAGPVKVTRGLLLWATLFRSWQVTPVGRGLGQAVV